MSLRPIALSPWFLRTAPSCLIEAGGTRVLCTATVAEGAPPFLRGTGRGWLTAEYAMLPASTGVRKARDGLKRDGRGVEISRLIGRSLRQAVDLDRLGERTITIDCDVLEADGGTRAAAITGGFVALALAVDKLMREGALARSPLTGQVAAISAGIVDGAPALDLCYAQDSRAQADMNVVMDDKGNFIEIQGTGERAAFTRKELDSLLALAGGGIALLLQKQREALGGACRWIAGGKPRLILATNNAHKASELKAMLAGRYAVVTQGEAGVSIDVAETGETFAQNAALKAEAILTETGCAALADDSGLCVDALGGAPGVRSARYAGEDKDDEANNRLLLENLADSPPPRTARFVSAVALARPGRETLVAEGSVEGRITGAPRGGLGFGYDPLFEYENGLTFAQMPGEEKNKISHRARALAALLAALEGEGC